MSDHFSATYANPANNRRKNGDGIYDEAYIRKLKQGVPIATYASNAGVSMRTFERDTYINSESIDSIKRIIQYVIPMSHLSPDEKFKKLNIWGVNLDAVTYGDIIKECIENRIETVDEVEEIIYTRTQKHYFSK